MKHLFAIGLALWAAAAVANPPSMSLRPTARPIPSAIEVTGGLVRAEGFMPLMSAQAVPFSLRPEQRTQAIRVMARRIQEDRERGAICGNRDIQGDVLGTYDGPGSCGVEGAVRVRAVSGVTLSTPAILDCTTAQALNSWVTQGLKPAIGTEGGGVASIRVFAHYACRTRNNQAGARMSEHSYGRAIDIGGFRLNDGSEISVLNGWGTRADGRQLREMHRAACGPFGTVLGPEANAFHRDHFHFDTARYRSGSYCR